MSTEKKKKKKTLKGIDRKGTAASSKDYILGMCYA
jgi:hypothetical protein